MSHKNCSSKIRTREEFYCELKREIARVRRYGHRITLLLIEPEEQLEGAELQEFKDELIRQLRTSDCAFFFGENRFAVILPNTHEAGGEAAALRIKRLICSAMNRRRSAPLALSSGVISLDSGVAQDIDYLVNDLEKDLERDKRCQSVDLREKKHQTVHAGKILFIGIDDEFVQQTGRLSGDEYDVSLVDAQQIMETLTGSSQIPVVIMGPDTDADEKTAITEKIRSNRELNNIYVVWLQNDAEAAAPDGEALCDIILSAKITPEILWAVIFQGLKIIALRQSCNETERFSGVLHSISAAAHQLNQPLQIIVGRLELIMLNMEDVPENREIIDDIKAMRTQALLAADINKKIGRLTKYQNKLPE